MEALSTYFAMNGYGFFIWTAYGLVLGCLILIAIFSLNQRRRLRVLSAQMDR